MIFGKRNTSKLSMRSIVAKIIYVRSNNSYYRQKYMDAS